MAPMKLDLLVGGGPCKRIPLPPLQLPLFVQLAYRHRRHREQLQQRLLNREGPRAVRESVTALAVEHARVEFALRTLVFALRCARENRDAVGQVGFWSVAGGEVGNCYGGVRWDRWLAFECYFLKMC